MTKKELPSKSASIYVKARYEVSTRLLMTRKLKPLSKRPT